MMREPQTVADMPSLMRSLISYLMNVRIAFLPVETYVHIKAKKLVQDCTFSFIIPV